MEQLCKSKVREGEYDSIIKFLINSYITDATIIKEMMRLTNGHENPKSIEIRIDLLRE